MPAQRGELSCASTDHMDDPQAVHIYIYIYLEETNGTEWR